MTGVDVETNSHREMINAMRSLETMVDQKGGINSVQHIADLIRWMSEAEGFDVRIVYVCVVNATESRDILSQFIQQGGWNCLAKWLEYFMASNKHAAIRELLLCFQKLPIEAKTLSVQVESKELPGKMIRSLRKHHDDEIKQIATAVYTTWKNLDEQEREKRAKKREKKTKEEIKPPKKQKTTVPVTEPKKPTLTNSFMDNIFLTEEQKKKAIEDKKKAKAKKKEEKKKKEEAKKTPIQFNEHLSFLNDIGKAQSATENTDQTASGEHHSKFENLGNRSPPMHHHGDNLNGIKGSPPHKNDIQPRKEPKPGAKLVRWTDSVNRPLEQVREFEIIPNERVNVNNRDYKIMMETEAFKEENNGTAPSLGDLAPKRQWRSPKRAATYFSQQVQKNLESTSKDSSEKTQAAEKTARTLQQIYLKAQIPFTPTEPDHSAQTPVGDIPRIPLVMKDSQEKQPEPAAAPAQPVPNINFDLLNQIVQTTNSNSHGSSSRSPSGGPPPPQRNPYDSMAPPPSYNGSSYGRGSSPLINDQREYGGYRRDYYSRGPPPPHQQQQQQPGYDRGYPQRRSRSPPGGGRNDQYHRNEPYRRPDSGYHNRGYARR